MAGHRGAERKGIWALDSVPEQEPDEIPPCVMVGQQLDWTEFAGLCWTIRTEGNIDRSQGRDTETLPIVTFNVGE